jgi:hypothetical protein
MARPRVHLAAAGLVLGLFHRHLSGPERVMLVAASVLIDVDHLLDYTLRRRQGRRRWVVLLLHGWEYVLVLALVGRRTRWAGPLRGAALGLLLHLALDQVTNAPWHPAHYSLLFRLRRRFAPGPLGVADPDHWMHQPWWQWL